MVDKVDLRIIRLLNDNGRISYTSIGRDLGITGAAVKKRMDKLNSKGLIDIGVNLNAQELGFDTGIVILTIRDPDTRGELVRRFSRCPRVSRIQLDPEGDGLILDIVTEKGNPMDRIVRNNIQSLRDGIDDIRVIRTEGAEDDPFIPRFDIAERREARVTPCGALCNCCDMYKASCTGCVPTIHYRGVL